MKVPIMMVKIAVSSVIPADQSRVIINRAMSDYDRMGHAKYLGKKFVMSGALGALAGGISATMRKSKIKPFVLASAVSSATTGTLLALDDDYKRKYLKSVGIYNNPETGEIINMSPAAKRKYMSGKY